MSVIYILITVSICIAVFFLISFLRAVKTGQYDDDYTPSVRMLFDDEIVKKDAVFLKDIEETKIVTTKTINNQIN
jgi:cbb3-type cytochrome oxidase maturation protein